ncbi:Hypothetical predicted protein [Podarcis lilfordi]|uniref:Uncharacterized protein n=1 Tax=Podarcis lilfordi TaxID=74358 RepID=A0AA35PJ27_9SAUR|nr:Hypothetical predicted protein [Podarcis lilfordi]
MAYCCFTRSFVSLSHHISCFAHSFPLELVTSYLYRGTLVLELNPFRESVRLPKPFGNQGVASDWLQELPAEATSDVRLPKNVHKPEHFWVCGVWEPICSGAKSFKYQGTTVYAITYICNFSYSLCFFAQYLACLLTTPSFLLSFLSSFLSLSFSFFFKLLASLSITCFLNASLGMKLVEKMTCSGSLQVLQQCTSYCRLSMV